MHAFRKRLSVCVCASFPFGFEGGMWDLNLIVLVPDHGISIYFTFSLMHPLLIDSVTNTTAHTQDDQKTKKTRQA